VRLCKSTKQTRIDPNPVNSSVQITPFGRMDEVKAARELVLCCWLPEDYSEE